MRWRLPVLASAFLFFTFSASLAEAKPKPSMRVLDLPLQPCVPASIDEAALVGAHNGIVREYSGPLRECADVQAFGSALEQLRKSAIQEAQGWLGLPESFVPVVPVSLCDRDKDGGEAAMDMLGLTVAGRPIGLIRVFAQGLVSRRMDPAVSLKHEVNHALLREYLGVAYYAQPVWFREGLAVLCADQVTVKTHQALVYGMFRAASVAEAAKVVALCCDGVDDPHDELDYAESGWWLRFLVNRKPDVVKDVIALIKEGLPLEEALAKTSGLAWADFKVAAGDYARRELYTAEAGAFVEYLPLVLRARDCLGDEVKPGLATAPDHIALKEKLCALEAALTTWFEDPANADSYARGLVLYWRMRIWVALGCCEDAASELSQALEPRGLFFESALTGGALMLLAVAAREAGNEEQACEVAHRVAQGFDYSPERLAWARAFHASRPAKAPEPPVQR